VIYPKPKFYNLDGRLTAYSLACGYIQDMSNGWKLYKDRCYHLQRSNSEWLTFTSLTKARKMAKQLTKANKHEVF
jgi:hypothetical protein